MRLRQLASDVWMLTKGYWGSDERWSARVLLTAVIGLNLGLVGVNVLQNQATGALFTALQLRDAPGFYRAFGIVVLLIGLYLAVAVLRVYLDQTLQLRWRRWLTDQYLTRWLANRAFYRMRFSGRVDNPDQRISEDVRLFIERTMSLVLGLVNSAATLVSFAALLWFLSGSITLPIGRFEITIPGYMFWVAVLYSGIGSVIAHLIGRPLIRLYNRQQAVEADFRFSLVRLREEAEGIALYGGEAQERRIALRRFRALYDNFKRIILRSNQFLMFQLLCSQGTSSFALLIAAPRYFSGAIQLGALTQTANAFERVNEALSWFIGSYTIFAEWRATVDRLTEFGAEIKRETAAAIGGPRMETAVQDAVDLADVGVSLPDGKPLLDPVTLSFKPHESVLLQGSSGSGKSTLFRVLAGLWPFATGHIRLPRDATTLFLPQRPYIPIGSLRGALWFPARAVASRDADVRTALASVGLPALRQRLNEEAHWGHVLSLGEQQRLAIARVLLIKPDWLFLDEATSAIDEAEEAALYRMVADALPATTVISIGHRASLEAFHQRVIVVDRTIGHSGRLIDRARHITRRTRPGAAEGAPMKTSYGWKLLPYLLPYRWRFVWALAQVFLIAGFELLKPWPLQVVIDNVLGGKAVGFTLLDGWSPLALLGLACLGIVFVQFVAGALTLLHNYTAIGVGQRMVNDIRGTLYSHLQRLSLAFHSRQKVGDIMFRITADSFAVQTMLMNGLLPIISAIVLLAGMLLILYPLDPLLTLLSISIVPFLFLSITLFNRRIADVATEVRDADSRVYSLVQWAFSSMKVVQAFTREEDEYHRFMGASRTSLGFTLKLYNWQTFYSGVINTLIAAGTALVIYVGARSVLTGTLSVGQLIVFISYLAQLYVPVNQLTQSFGLIASARISARRVFEILETEADLKDGPLTLSPKAARGAIEWHDVSFRYRAEMPVLRSIDLTVKPGMKVAVVGPTGAGKSTMLGLLPRFFDPSTGNVAIGGVDVREFTLKSLRRQIAMVLQPPLIFPISLRDNLAYGRPEATSEEIEEAARLASIHTMIMGLPQGYDTVIGEAGATLSEGEKQRLTIARALLRDAPILILDEPTSALDVATEAQVMAGIRRLTAGRTTFIVAHRLSTIRTCDLILVLRDGIIAEQGTFAELMCRNGVFAELYNTQFRNTEESPLVVA